MYDSLQLPWSLSPSPAEESYRSAGLVRTQGTLFLLPPSLDLLISTFDSPPRPRSTMSSGAVALCKHFERGGASSENGLAHPYWPLPRGTNENKTRLAKEVLDRMLEDVQWRNVMLLHRGVAVYEIRQGKGYGMRWTLGLGPKALFHSNSGCDVAPGPSAASMQTASSTSESGEACLNNNLGDEPRTIRDDDRRLVEDDMVITRVIFRGFLEPIIGLDHELPAS